MKKKILIVVIIVLLLILLIPIPMHLKDGGTVEYKALTYKVSKVHRLPMYLNENYKYEEGLIIEILGFEIFNNVNSNKKDNKKKWTQLNESENYAKEIDNIKIELKIPTEWKYKEIPKDKDNDFYKYALKLYKNNEDQYAMLYFYNNPFGVCGTGRTSEKVTLNNGEEAIIGYYDGNKNWSDISFYNINKSIAVINNGLINDEANEVIEFIKTINVAEKKSVENFEILFYDKHPMESYKIYTILDKSETEKYDYTIYGYDGSVNIRIDGEDYSLKTALLEDRITMEEIIEKANKDFPNAISYDDGGSMEYHYNNYTIIKCNRLDGNRDVYIGTKDMTLNDVL